MEEVRELLEAEKILEIPISWEEKGKEIGKEIGKELGKKEMALELLKRGLDVEFVAEVSKFSAEEIEEANLNDRMFFEKRLMYDSGFHLLGISYR